MKLLPLTALLSLSLIGTARAEPFAKGDAEAGKKFFAQNQCNSCHDSIMHGDGNAIFSRPGRKVRSPEQLVAQLRRCSGGAGIILSPRDEENLGAYLNLNYYHFK